MRRDDRGMGLEEVFSVEYGYFEVATVEIFDATQVDATMAGFTQHFIVRVNSTASAKIVFGDAVTELVQAEVFRAGR